MDALRFARRAQVPAGLVGMLALILAIEAAIVRDDLRLSSLEADTWRGAMHAAEHPRPGGVLLLGDSQVELGVSPRAMEAELGVPVRDLAVPSGQPTSSYVLLKRALTAGAKPSAVVINFEPHLLINDRSPGARMWPEIANLADSIDLAWTLRSPDDFAQMLVATAVPSYRARHEVRGSIGAAFRGETSDRSQTITMVRRNRQVNRGAVLADKTAPDKLHDITAFGNQIQPWVPSAVNETYATRILDLAAAHGIPVYAVLMPVVPNLWYKAAVTGQETAYIAWLARLQRAHSNLFLLDFRPSGYPNEAFIDAVHLNFAGAVSVGKALGQHLRMVSRDGRPQAPCTLMPGFRSDGSEAVTEHLAQSAAQVAMAEAARRRR